MSPHHERMQNDARQLDRQHTYTNERKLDGSQVTDMEEYPKMERSRILAVLVSECASVEGTGSPEIS